MGKGGFQGLVVWQKAKELAVRIYKISNEGSLGKDVFESLDSDCKEIGRMLGALTKSRCS